MTLQEKKRIIKESGDTRSLCAVQFAYFPRSHDLFPLLTGDTLFLSAVESDFMLDGYTIRRFRDVKKAEIRTGKIPDMLRKEGVVDAIAVPGVDVSTWRHAIASLLAIGRNVIVESEHPDGANDWFYLGQIEKVQKTCCYVRRFDADGVWDAKADMLPYSEITSVSFDSRYVNVFSKYMDPPEPIRTNG